MARGFLSGIIWGGLVSVIGAGTASIIAQDRTPPAVEAVSPSGAQAPEAGADMTASGVTDADLVRAGEAVPVTSPDTDDLSAATAAGSDTPTVPQTGAADALAPPATAADTGAVAIDDVAPVAPGAASDAPSAPTVEPELSISTEPAQPAPPSVPETEGAFAPDQEDAPTPPIPEAPAPQTPDVAVAPAAPEEGEEPAETEPEQDPAPEEADEQIAALPNALDSEDDIRPRIGRPGVSLVERTPTVPTNDAAPTVEAGEAETNTRAIVAHATSFSNPDDKPLMSIVLIDSGVDLTGGPVGLAALQSFPYPLTFAVDASLDDAGTRMAEYRREGFEVMALINLPRGATATDAEVSLSAALDAVPEAVAVMEGTGTGVQENRDAADQIAQAVQATGHGLVLASKGLNTTQKLAAREGVPAGLIFRDFDSADQTPSVIRRFLDQAAFRAGQEGGVIMVGRVRPDTISALLLWGLQDRAERVALAPISAVLTALVPPQ